MDLSCAYSALGVALDYGTTLGFIVFLQVLIEYLRPDIVDTDNRVAIVSTEDILYSYDFVIIGAGSAGSVLANRLTENSNWTVLLLEAGGNESVMSDVPTLHYVLQRTDLDWQYKTEPSSTYCLGMNNHRCNWPRGKGLGGSSMINSMMYVRGNKRDYDGWRDLGNAGWGYEDVLPYFKRSEDMKIPELRNSTYHGTGGYVTIEESKYRSEITENFLAAGIELGYNLTDYNGESQTGFRHTQGTLRNGLRCSAAKAFLRSASNRTNLHVSTESMVHKILINETTKTAYGVQFQRGTEAYTVYVNKEVILSAGAVQSPQILMLSGIGPKEHLEDVGIEVIHDSPGVGQNLKDHVYVGGLTYLYDATTDASSENSTDADVGSESFKLVTLSGVEEFLNEETGSLYGFTGSEALGFIDSGLNDDTLDYPDVEIIFAAGGDNAGGGILSKQYFGLTDTFGDRLYENIADNTSYMIAPVILRPKSKGYIKLQDSNPNHHPVIVPNYLDHPEDLNILVKACQFIHKISQTSAMRKINPRPNPNLTPGCGHFNPSSDDYYKCHIRHYTMTLYHPCCTCKMGHANDSMAVVDSRLKVHGIKALRVVDASVMPTLVSGHLDAVTQMVAEKAADFVKEDFSDSAAVVE